MADKPMGEVRITIEFTGPRLHEWEEAYLRHLLGEMVHGYLSKREAISRVAMAEIRAGASVQ